MYPDVQLYIDGAWKSGAANKSHDVLNPATGEAIGQVPHAEKADLDQALASAQKAFLAWKGVSAFERYKLLRKAADVLRARSEAMATVLTMEQGKPLPEAKMEMQTAVDVIDWFAEEGRRAYGRVIPARGQGIYQLVLKEPVGPVAGFVPWNFPVNQSVRKIGAALAAGCSIILKGPEETPASCALLVKCFEDAGLPKGLINWSSGCRPRSRSTSSRTRSSARSRSPARCRSASTSRRSPAST